MALWRAKQATITIAETIAEVLNTVELTDATQQLSSVDFSGQIKSVSISGAESDVESVFLFGINASGSQNADITESNMSMREFSATLVYKDATVAELGGASKESIAATGFNRITGDTLRTLKSVLISFTDGNNSVNVLLNDAYMTKLGDISLDAEGHAEQEIMFKCLAKDYYEEDDFT